MKPLISVVMPVHNGGAYLDAAVDSILTQSYSRLELILVDDNSSDNAIDKLDKSDDRLKIIQTNERGIAGTFNTGFGHSMGQYVARMDADDISLKRRLEYQLDYMDQNPGVDIAGCCVEIFSQTGLQGGLQRYQQWLNSVRDPGQVHRQIFVESPLPNPGTMFRRKALQQLGGYRQMDWPEDYDLYLRADAAGMQMGKPEPVLLRWREHELRVTHTEAVYQREQFMRAKAHFLVHHRLKGKPVIIWGAGPTGRQMHDFIIAEGGVIQGFLEVHPRRIGGHKRALPVWALDKLEEEGLPMVLVAVGAAGARAEISVFMNERNKTEGRDYLFIA